MWQMGGLGFMLGQVHHFVKYNAARRPMPRIASAAEALRLE